MITAKTIDFLNDLKENNNRPWFDANKSRYKESHEELITFAETLLSEMGKHDDIVPATGKKSLFRIYRDVRFSKDKSPYKTHWAGFIKRDSVWKRGGYYFHISTDETFLGCGFWKPEKDDLKLIRDHISADAAPLRKILNSQSFKALRPWLDCMSEMLTHDLNGEPLY